MIKNVIFCFVIILLTSGCTVTNYEGSMTFPQNIMFDEANFKYVKTIMGSSRAVYNGFGYDRVRDSNGLINSAKAQMYETHTFMPNQVITNISRDIIRTSGEKLLSSRYEVKVIMSADVYEFSNNGVYSYEDEINDSLPPNIKKVPIYMAKLNTLESTNPSNKENPDYIIVDEKRYSVGDEVVYTFSNKSAIIEKFIRNKHTKYFYEVEIRIKKSNKVKQTSFEYISK